MKLPQYLKKYFWDVTFSRLNLREHRLFILKRILEYGDERGLNWMWDHFLRSEIVDALLRARGFSQKSANYWALVLGVPREKVKCLKKRSSRAPKSIWHY
jgi:hypothetical protein